MTIWRQNIRVKPLALLWHVALAIYIKITQGCVFLSCCHTSGFYFNRESQLRRTCGNMGIYCRWAICSLLNKSFNENMKKWSSLYVSINNNQIILTWKKNADQKNDVHDWACTPTDRGRHCPRRRWLDRPASFYASSPEHLLICQSAAEAGPSTDFTVRYYSTFLPLNKHAEVSSWSLRCGSSSILSAFGVCCGLLIWSSATECWRAPCFFFFFLIFGTSKRRGLRHLTAEWNRDMTVSVVFHFHTTIINWIAMHAGRTAAAAAGGAGAAAAELPFGQQHQQLRWYWWTWDTRSRLLESTLVYPASCSSGADSTVGWEYNLECWCSKCSFSIRSASLSLEHVSFAAISFCFWCDGQFWSLKPMLHENWDWKKTNLWQTPCN